MNDQEIIKNQINIIMHELIEQKRNIDFLYYALEERYNNKKFDLMLNTITDFKIKISSMSHNLQALENNLKKKEREYEGKLYQ